MTIAEETLRRIPAIVAGNGDRPERARELAEALRRLGNYRWTGVYDVGSEMVMIIAYSGPGTHSGTNNGPGAPAHPTFPITRGLTGAAIRGKATVVVGDVRTDLRYLIAFGSTLSEIIVPILDPKNGAVIGTIDVESEKANAFSPQDQIVLEKCARAALPLWIGQ